jgi:hypothetical protein
MRIPVLSVLLIAAALLCEIQAALSQSAYSYPWCARVYERNGPTSCYFNSYEQCMTTLSGVGGYCFKSPYYHAVPAKPTVHPRRYRHA